MLFINRFGITEAFFLYTYILFIYHFKTNLINIISLIFVFIRRKIFSQEIISYYNFIILQKLLNILNNIYKNKVHFRIYTIYEDQ